MKTQLISALFAGAAVLCAATSTANSGLLDSVSSAVDSTKSTTNQVSNVTTTAKDPKAAMKRKVGIKGDLDPSKNSLRDNADNVTNTQKAAKDPVNTLNPLTAPH